MRSDLSNTTPTVYRISETDQLQAALDRLSGAYNDPDSRGAILRLGKGTYDCDLTIHHPFVTIQGEGEMTEILGKVTVYAGHTSLSDMVIRGAGKPYGLRVMRNPAAGYQNVARCKFKNLGIGASYEGAGDGPVNSLEIDGVYLTSFEHVTCAFATSNGMLIDSTDVRYPSTTLDFKECSFVSNADRGAWIKGSLGICRFQNGNFEQNGVSDPATKFEVQLEACNNIIFDGVDFETDLPLAAVIQASNVNPMTIRDCSFFATNSTEDGGSPPQATMKPLLALLIQSCAFVSVHDNRFAGFNAGRIGFMDNRSSRCSERNNAYFDIHQKNGQPLTNWIQVVRT